MVAASRITTALGDAVRRRSLPRRVKVEAASPRRGSRFKEAQVAKGKKSNGNGGNGGNTGNSGQGGSSNKGGQGQGGNKNKSGSR
jgi:hypothetical protein